VRVQALEPWEAWARAAPGGVALSPGGVALSPGGVALSPGGVAPLLLGAPPPAAAAALVVAAPDASQVAATAALQQQLREMSQQLRQVQLALAESTQRQSKHEQAVNQRFSGVGGRIAALHCALSELGDDVATAEHKVQEVTSSRNRRIASRQAAGLPRGASDGASCTPLRDKGPGWNPTEIPTGFEGRSWNPHWISRTLLKARLNCKRPVETRLRSPLSPIETLRGSC
jgi:gas vesicle protein